MAVFLVSFLSSLAAQERSDTVYTFRFVPGKNMFYVSYKGNEAEIARLEKCVEQHRADILAGSVPVRVDGYCSSAGSEARNLAVARIRSNRVKSELITRRKLNEDCFVTENHSSGGDCVTVRIAVPAAQSRDDAARLAREQAEQQRRTSLMAEQQARERAEQERKAKASAAQPSQELVKDSGAAEQAEPQRHAAWYAGLQGGLPFGVSAMSSFGEDGTDFGWSAGVYGGYRFNSVLSAELQAAWGQITLSSRGCCPGYWIGADGHLYEAAVAGMQGWDWHALQSRVFMQRYAAQLNINVLGFFAATRGSRWTLDLSPHIAAVGTKADLRTLDGKATVLENGTRWHLGAGGNIQVACRIAGGLSLGIYTGITYLTGKPLDGTPKHLHDANYVWESGLKLGWDFGYKTKEDKR